MLGCGPGDRAAPDDAGIPVPCADFDLVLPATGDEGGYPSGFVWTGDGYLVLWTDYAADHLTSTLVALDPVGTVLWTHDVHASTGGLELAWDGHVAVVAFGDLAGTTMTVLTIDPTTQLETTVFETTGSVEDPIVTGANGRVGVAWREMGNYKFFELSDGQVGPIATLPASGPLSDFVTTSSGYAISSRAPSPNVVLFDRTFTPQHFAIASDIDLDTGPLLAVTADGVVAVQAAEEMPVPTPMIDVDFVPTGRRVVLPLPFDSLDNVAVDHGVVYLAGRNSDGTTNHVETVALGDDGTTTSAPQVLFTDPLVGGVSSIMKDGGRTAFIAGLGTEKPNFVVGQRCDQTVE